MWVEKQNKMFFVDVITKVISSTIQDNEDMFTLNSLFINVINNCLFYIGTLILSGYSDGYFFILGGVVILVNGIALFLYMRAERELNGSAIGIVRDYNRMLQNFILGVDSCRAYDKVNKARDRFMDALYTYGTVFKINMKWITQGLSIISDITGLGVTFGASAFAIGSKFAQPKRVNIIGSSISLSTRLSGLSSSITRDISSMETLMRFAVVQSQLRRKLPYYSHLRNYRLIMINLNPLRIGRRKAQYVLIKYHLRMKPSMLFFSKRLVSNVMLILKLLSLKQAQELQRRHFSCSLIRYLSQALMKMAVREQFQQEVSISAKQEENVTLFIMKMFVKEFCFWIHSPLYSQVQSDKILTLSKDIQTRSQSKQ